MDIITVTLRKDKYYDLLWAEAQLEWLDALGVNNWPEYSVIPHPSHFENLVDWENAIDELYETG